MIDDDDECGAVGGMRIGRGSEVLGENLLQCHFVHPSEQVIAIHGRIQCPYSCVFGNAM
jgi:hypothetical protein